MSVTEVTTALDRNDPPLKRSSRLAPTHLVNLRLLDLGDYNSHLKL